jgi:hypothetical protein
MSGFSFLTLSRQSDAMLFTDSLQFSFEYQTYDGEICRASLYFHLARAAFSEGKPLIQQVKTFSLLMQAKANPGLTGHLRLEREGTLA